MRQFTILGILGAIILMVALGIALREHGAPATGVVARGVVTQLDPPPYHAHVTVTPANGAPFQWFTSSRDAMHVGQVLNVRFSPDDPSGSATLADRSPYAMAINLALIGAALLIGALISPWLLARFPNLLAPRVR